MSCCFPKIKPFPDIFVADFDDLKSHAKFPNSKEIKLYNINQINVEQSFLVYISHAWLSNTNPDNENCDKFHLTINGIMKLKESMTSIHKCYIWMDYICLKGNEKKKEDFYKLFYYSIEFCDCMFTPIVDHLVDHWKLDYSEQGYFVDYKASSFNGGKDLTDTKCYLNHSWCRTEAFYCSNLPLHNAKSPQIELKIETYYKNSLKRLASQGYRPHFLFGSREQSLNIPPFNLAQLQNTYFDKYDPMKGSVRDEADKEIINILVEELKSKFSRNMQMGYIGDIDEKGLQNGLGRYLSHSYDVYFGFYLNNKRHNQGSYYAANGDHYDGNWLNNQKHGEGTMHYINGNIYAGSWGQDVYEGKGLLTYSLLSEGPYLSYDGTWSGGKREGEGKCVYKPGNQIAEISGNWHKNQTKGKNQITYSDGSVYDGDTKDAIKHGKGKYSCAEGVFKGDFKHGLYHGRGLMEFSTGVVYNGEWSEGKMEGRGSMKWGNGDEYDGYFKNSKRSGHGKCVFKDGTAYVGEWADDKRHGKGKLISADESSVTEAVWAEDVMQEK